MCDNLPASRLVKPYVCIVPYWVGVAVRTLFYIRKKPWLVYCLTMSVEGLTYWSESTLEYNMKMTRR